MNTLPRFPLATLPTPITDAVRLREALGGASHCPRILIKRDDLTALGLGGNKARKLEYLIADALAKGAHTVVTTGAVQSNHARMTAAAARIAGLKCVLVLSSRYDVPAVEGNLLLDYLFGAEVRFVPAEDPMLAVGHDAAVVADVVHEEAAAGRTAYVIPVGGSSPVGSLGYVSGTAELVEQLRGMGSSPSRLYYASGSRGTQAGLTLGAKLSEAPYELWGIAVSAGEAREDRAREERRQRRGGAPGSTHSRHARRSVHRSGFHRRRLRHPHASRAGSHRSGGGHRGDPAGSRLHLEGVLRSDPACAFRRNPAHRHDRLSAHRRDARAVHARVRRHPRLTSRPNRPTQQARLVTP